jgi:hypothetical protein
MPQRPRSHQLESLATTHLESMFREKGWIVERLREDYGEDLFVRIFQRGRATNFSFFVQSKATDSARVVRNFGEKCISVRITSDHARHWLGMGQPVLLTIYDSINRVTYWETVQTYLESDAGPILSASKRTVTVHIPMTNVLDPRGLNRIQTRTEKRFWRLEAQKTGVTALLRNISDVWGVKINYDAEKGVMVLPDGRFNPSGTGGAYIFLFGDCGSDLIATCNRHGLDPEKFAQNALKSGLKLLNQIITVGKAEVRLPNGTTKLYTSARQFLDECAARNEEP